MSTNVYGFHLTLRASNIRDQAALDDLLLIGGFLRSLVKRIGMRVLAGPLVEREDGPEDKYGCSGIVLLYESHAAIHTYPRMGELFIDVFSCKEFDVSDVNVTVLKFFGPYRLSEQTLFERGVHWGANVNEEMVAWANAR